MPRAAKDHRSPRPGPVPPFTGGTRPSLPNAPGTGGGQGTPSRCGSPAPPHKGQTGDRTRSLFTMSNNTPRDGRAGDAPDRASPTGEFLCADEGSRPSRSNRPPRPGASRGGARRDRTDDLMLAKHALSQLSYGPMGESSKPGRGWWAWEDSNFRPHAYQARALTD